jgi:large subunit ribosomal protein L19
MPRRWNERASADPTCSVMRISKDDPTFESNIGWAPPTMKCLPVGGAHPAKGIEEMSQQILELVEKSSLKPEIPSFAIGDTVDVHTKILEGDKERIQVFTGVVIARSGSGSREMFTVRRIVANEGVERKFPLHSPKIEKIVVVRSGVVRRAKLYFLRDRVGKAVRLKERRRDTSE